MTMRRPITPPRTVEVTETSPSGQVLRTWRLHPIWGYAVVDLDGVETRVSVDKVPLRVAQRLSRKLEGE